MPIIHVHVIISIAFSPITQYNVQCTEYSFIIITLHVGVANIRHLVHVQLHVSIWRFLAALFSAFLFAVSPCRYKSHEESLFLEKENLRSQLETIQEERSKLSKVIMIRTTDILLHSGSLLFMSS